MEELVREPGESLLAYAKRRATALGLVQSSPSQEPAQSSTPSWDADLVPEVAKPTLTVDQAKERYEIDQVLGGIDIVEAYNRWCKKSVADPAGKRESIMVSCPSPSHPDRNPSSWLTLDKGDGGVGYCEPCQLGYDKYDIAAWHFGFDVPGYKGSDFPELRRKMAEDLGYTVVVSGKDEWLSRTEHPTQPLQVAEAKTREVAPEKRADEDAASPGTIVLAPATEKTFDPIDQFLLDEIVIPTFDWRRLKLQQDSFLARWLNLTSDSYEPEEFYLWEGLMALGCAVGNRVAYDDTIPVRPNLMVCLIGATGAGKSIAISVFEQLIRTSFPWDSSIGGGVRLVSSPGSGEALLDQFQHSVMDSVTKKVEFFPVNGLYRESELASFAKRTARPGNTMRELIMDLYDRSHPVSSVSRTAGSVTASDHFMQMITSTQPMSLQTLLTTADAGAGFLNRWVFAFGAYKVRPPRNALRINIDPCVDLLRRVKGWGSPGKQVKFVDGSDAAKLWDKFYMSSIHPLTMDEDAWMAARLPLLAKKMVLLFAINDHSTEIQVQHVQGLMAMWPYLLRCYGIVSENIGQDEVEDCSKKIEAYLAAHLGEGYTLREIMKQSAARRFRKEIVLRSVDVLLRGSLIEEIPRAKSDRVIRYTYSAHSSTKLSIVSNI